MLLWVWDVREKIDSFENGSNEHSALVASEDATRLVRVRCVDFNEQIAEILFSAPGLEALQSTAGKDFIIHSSDDIAVACHRSKLASASNVLR